MINFTNIKVGERYDRKYLAKKWGYKKENGISRGIVTPKGQNIIVLFVTKEKQASLPQYNDYFDEKNKVLVMDGEEAHRNDRRLIESYKNKDNIYLFYREKHNMSFEYKGIIYLKGYQINVTKPSKFLFSVSKIYNEENNEKVNNISSLLREVDVDTIASYESKNDNENSKYDLSKAIEIRKKELYDIIRW